MFFFVSFFGFFFEIIDTVQLSIGYIYQLSSFLGFFPENFYICLGVTACVYRQILKISSFFK